MASEQLEITLVAIDRMSKVMNKMIKLVDKLEKEMGDLGKQKVTLPEPKTSGFKKLGEAVTGVFSTFKGGLNVLADFTIVLRGGLDVAKVAVGVFAELGGAVAGFLGDSVKQAAEFEKGMKNVQAVTGATGKEFDMLQERALQLSSDTVKSASEITDAFYKLGSAGLDAAQSVEAVGPAINLSIATATDMDTVTGALVGSLNGLREGFDQTERFANVMAATIKNSQQTMSGLANGLSFVIPTAKAAGLSFEEVSGAMGQLANASFLGSRAGTSLNQILLQMIQPTSEIEKLYRKYGVSLDSVNPKVVGFEKAMDNLGKSGAEQGEIIKAFGIRAGPALAALLTQGTDEMGRMRTAVTGTTAAQSMMETQAESLAVQYKSLQGSVESLQIVIGQAFTPGLTQVVKVLIQLVNDTRSWINSTKLAEKATAIFSAAGEELGEVLDMLRPIFKPLADGAAEFIKNLDTKGIVAWIKGISDMLRQSATFQAFVQTAGTALKNLGSGFASAVKAVEQFGQEIGKAFKATDTGEFKIDFGKIVEDSLRFAVEGLGKTLNILRDPLIELFSEVGLGTVEYLKNDWRAEIETGVITAVGLAAVTIGAQLGGGAAVASLGAGLVGWLTTSAAALAGTGVAAGVAASIVAGITAAIALVPALLVSGGAGLLIGTAINNLLLSAAQQSAVGKALLKMAQWFGFLPDYVNDAINKNADQIDLSVIEKTLGAEAAARVKAGEITVEQAILEYKHKINKPLQENKELDAAAKGAGEVFQKEIPEEIRKGKEPAGAASKEVGEATKAPMVEGTKGAAKGAGEVFQKEVPEEVRKGREPAKKAAEEVRNEMMRPFSGDEVKNLGGGQVQYVFGTKVPEDIRTGKDPAKAATGEVLQAISGEMTGIEEKILKGGEIKRTFSTTLPAVIKEGEGPTEDAVNALGKSISAEPIQHSAEKIQAIIRDQFLVKLPANLRGGNPKVQEALKELEAAFVDSQVEQKARAVTENIDAVFNKELPGVMENANPALKAAMSKLKDTVLEEQNLMSGSMEEAAKEAGAKAGKGTASGIASSMEEAVAAMATLNTRLSSVIDLSAEMETAGKAIPSSLAEGVDNNVHAAVDKFKSMQDRLTKVLEFREDLKAKGKDIPKDLADGFNSNIQSAVSEFTAAQVELVSAMDMKDEMLALGEDAPASFVEGVESKLEAAKAKLKAASDSLSDAMDISTTMGEMGSNSLNEFSVNAEKAAKASMPNVGKAMLEQLGPIEQKFLDQGLELADNYVGQIGETIKLSVDEQGPTWGEIMSGPFKELNGKTLFYGQQAGDSFAQGVAARIAQNRKEVWNSLGGLKDGMAGNSPPKEGPLSDIDKWGEPVADAYMGGLAMGLSDGSLAAEALKNSLGPIMEMMVGSGEKIAESGGKVGKGYMTSLAAAISDGKNAIDVALDSTVAARMKGNSPPPEGPLSDIDVGAKRVGESFIDNLIQPINTGMAKVDEALRIEMPGIPAPNLSNISRPIPAAPTGVGAIGSTLRAQPPSGIPSGPSSTAQSIDESTNINVSIPIANMTGTNAEQVENLQDAVRKTLVDVVDRAGLRKKRGTQILR